MDTIPPPSPTPDPSSRPTAPRRDRGFGALAHPGFRLYFAGMFGRGTSTWMQLVAVPWFAVELGASPGEVGIIAGLLFLPTLPIAPFGGVLADRVDRGRVLILTQVGSVVLSIALAVLAATDTASIPIVAGLALFFGVITAIELPVRQSYLTELVPREQVSSAVSLHATAWNTTRFTGPGLAGLTIAASGLALTFAVSAVLAAVVTVSMVWLERYRHHRLDRSGDPPSSVLAALREGAGFAFRQPDIRWALVFVASGGILGIQVFQTLAPLFVAGPLGLDGGGYGAFMAVWGAGAVVAAYVITYLAVGERRVWLIGGAGALAILLAALAIVARSPEAFVIVALLGVAQIALVQNALVIVQRAAPDRLRGRVMGLYATVFQGTQPFGAFLAGWLAELVGVRGAMVVGAAALLAVAVVGAIRLRAAATAGRP